ncbi:hypothetical protein G6011_05415 [Alternaria panax]|uniref:Uncharacterized protein n=1 Tax=Alternaria panax TaxID=48097 RepID=A0AAD4I907_9PLEO|nr:hypothetical protein G6011_05415 [Alternaria panax]
MALATPLAPLYSTYSTTPYEPSNRTSARLGRRMERHQCPAIRNHFPNFESWEKGMNRFCENDGNKKVYWDKPLIMTLILNGHDNRPIEWVFRIAVDNGNTPEAAGQLHWSYKPSVQGCKNAFMGFTKGKGGGVDKAYCNRNSLDDNSLDHLMLGGKYDEPINREYWATVTWETRAKRGQKGVDRNWGWGGESVKLDFSLADVFSPRPTRGRSSSRHRQWVVGRSGRAVEVGRGVEASALYPWRD